MKKKLIHFVALMMLLSVVTLSNGQLAIADDHDFDWIDNPDGTVTIKEYTGSSKVVIIPDTLGGKTVTSIGDLVFYDNLLTDVTLPNGLTSIGVQAFYNNRLTSVTLPNSLTSIGYQAFINNRLTDVTMPNSLTSIGNRAFDLNRLTSVTLPDGLTSIGSSVFANNQLTSIILPDSLTSIGDRAFESNLLTSVKLPDKLTRIGGSAFNNNQLMNVTLPDSLTSIGEGVFSDNQLTNVTLPDNLEIIGHYAFRNNQLTSIILPDRLKSIENYAFYNNKLKNVTVLSDSTLIGRDAFASTKNDSNFTVYGHISSTAQKHATDEKHSFQPITYKVAYDGNGNTGGNVPVDSNTYKRQTPVTALDNNTDQLIKTGYTFDGWNTLVDGTGVDYAVNSTFQMGEADVTLYAKWKVNSPVIYKWIDNPDGTVTIKDYIGSSKDVIVPDTLGGKTVTSIGRSAFAVKELTSVTIPNGVTNIDIEAFYGNKLTHVTIPASIKIIGYHTFSNNMLTSVTIPDGVTSIGNFAFSSNELTNVTIPASVTSIHTAAFSDNKLITVTIPDGVRRIGEAAFSGNELTNVKIPSSVTGIARSAFQGNKLTSLTIPSTITSIGDYAFNINKLTSLTIPSTVTSIGDYTFGRNDLTSVTIWPEKVAIQSTAFLSQSAPADLTIYGHNSSTAKDHANLSNYKFRPITHKVIYNGNEHTEGTAPSDSKIYKWSESIVTQSNTGRLVKKGYTFDGWSSTAEGTGVNYAENSTFSADVEEENIVLYAKWTLNKPADTIDTVNTIRDIHVPVSADTASINLPKNVGVTLSDMTTSSIPVAWDGGTPVFDGKTPGNYLFTGTLTPPTGVTNPKNLTANLNVIVRPTGTDTEVPIWPAGSDLLLTDITTTSVRLSWLTATDNIAVTSYHIYVDGVEKAVVGNQEHSYIFTGLNTQTTYNFTVRAYDAAGNASMALGKSATTLSPPVNPVGGGGSEPSYVPSSNTDLQELKVLLNGQMLTLTPDGSAFTLKTEASEVELFPMTAHSAAKVTLDGKPLVKGQKTPLHEGTNVFELTIEAENGTKKTYAITIQRTPTEPVAPIVPVEPDSVKPVKPIKFSDMPGHWAEDYIQQATTLGIIKGYSDGTFKPNDQLTRAQAASFLVRALNLKADKAAPFKDIGNYNNEIRAEIAAAHQFNIIKGSNGAFKPNDKITRAQIALMIERAYAYKAETKYTAAKAPYSDIKNYGAETANAISTLHELGIVTGSNGKFNPGDLTTRAQAAKMLVNLLNSLK